jgi:DNA-binding PadR family transcriptional regulator
VANQSAAASRREAAAPGPVRLSFVENVVLALMLEAPTHGFSIARILGREGAIGRVYEVSRPLVYRAVDRLVEAGLARPLRVEAGDHGPPRTVVMVTGPGRRAVRTWLNLPAEHVRDIRTELLVKLALLDRSGKDPQPLLDAQRKVLEPIVAGLAELSEHAQGFDQTVTRWRYETALAALRFVGDAVRP